ncbi:hypothetical protein NIES2130_15900 [Scytonema sp. HK-05]|nr:hypothetical protein NIES2130_15900 [Scytonema sp. HK-05]
MQKLRKGQAIDLIKTREKQPLQKFESRILLALKYLLWYVNAFDLLFANHLHKLKIQRIVRPTLLKGANPIPGCVSHLIN